jgi:glycerol-3-phosphate dehydrogenase
MRSMRHDVFDLLVVGAGATGCGTALDAASRGLSVALIDKGDIAGGTSSRSTQLVHGGLRYLQNGDFGLVREALRERELLLTTLAPALVRPMPFLLPLRHRLWERAYLGAGLALYDTLARSGTLPRHRHLSRRGALARFPDLNPNRIVGAMEFYDAKMDDARLAVAIARTAQALGAKIAPHVALVESDGLSADGIWHVNVRDEATGELIEVKTRSIALCVGVWAPELSALFHGRSGAVTVTRSKGVHIRLPRDAINGHTALILPTGRSVLFAIPEADHWIVGTTDTEWFDDPDAVAPDSGDVTYLLQLLDGVLTRRIDPSEVTYTFAGLRPLVRDQSVGGDTTKVTREHRIARIAPHVFSIVGGKWTTYRVMARDVVDTVVHDLDVPASTSRTETIPLIVDRATEIEEIVADNPALTQELSDAPGFTYADVIHALQYEGAVRLDDVVDRRLRLPRKLDQVTPRTRQEISEVMEARSKLAQK